MFDRLFVLPRANNSLYYSNIQTLNFSVNLTKKERTLNGEIT